MIIHFRSRVDILKTFFSIFISVETTASVSKTGSLRMQILNIWFSFFQCECWRFVKVEGKMNTAKCNEILVDVFLFFVFFIHKWITASENIYFPTKHRQKSMQLKLHKNIKMSQRQFWWMSWSGQVKVQSHTRLACDWTWTGGKFSFPEVQDCFRPNHNLRLQAMIAVRDASLHLNQYLNTDLKGWILMQPLILLLNCHYFVEISFQLTRKFQNSPILFLMSEL